LSETDPDTNRRTVWRGSSDDILRNNIALGICDDPSNYQRTKLLEDLIISPLCGAESWGGETPEPQIEEPRAAKTDSDSLRRI